MEFLSHNDGGMRLEDTARTRGMQNVRGPHLARRCAACVIMLWKDAMRVPVGNEEWYLCDWSDQPEDEYIEFRGNRTLALQWARQIHHDFFARGALRALLGGPHPPLSEEQIVR